MLMRVNSYICDICGEQIIPETRPIELPGGSAISSARKSIQQITFQQIDVEDNSYILTTEQKSKSYQVCQACWDAVCNTLKTRKEITKNELDNI